MNKIKLDIVKTERCFVAIDLERKISQEEINVDKFPLIVIEKLTDGSFMLWQIDNLNDVDMKNQYHLYATDWTLKIKNVPQFKLEKDKSPNSISVISDFSKPHLNVIEYFYE